MATETPELIQPQIRCRCGKLHPWSETDPLYVWCDRCGELVVMPSRSWMASQDRLTNDTPPYLMEISSPELDAVTDGLEELLKFIAAKTAATPGYEEENVREHAAAYVFVRQLKQRLEASKDA